MGNNFTVISATPHTYNEIAHFYRTAKVETYDPFGHNTQPTPVNHPVIYNL